MTMIAILDYDAGNIRSVEKALQHLGEETILTHDFREIQKADKVILPGVGAFGDAMEHLKHYELDRAIKEVVAMDKPFLGICLGLQLLFESSDETPGVEGLGILKGNILRIPEEEGLKIPHWIFQGRDVCFGIYRQIRMSILYILIIYRRRNHRLLQLRANMVCRFMPL